MGVARRGEIAACLIRHGRSGETPVAFIENGTTPKERVVVTTLAGAGEAQVDAPAVMVIGEVVSLRRALGDAARGDALVDLAGLV